MAILDILNGQWAILPENMQQIRAIYDARVNGAGIDLAAVEQQLGRPLANEDKTYYVVSGVAVLPIEGVVAKKMNLFSRISGGASLEIAKLNLDAAQADPTVHSIIQYVSSPGGTVDGTQLYADAVFAARAGKPIVTLGSGVIASAAYWFGSAASRLYLEDGTTVAGSIGVATEHTDISAAQASSGRKTTDIFAGKYKRITSSNGPLSDEGRQTIQDQVDYTYTLFVDAVAKNRGVQVETVLASMADGRVFMGQQAVDAGLADGIISLDNLIVQLNDEYAQAGKNGSKKSYGKKEPTMSILTIETVEKENPAIAAQLRQQGAEMERERIQSVEAQSFPGHEALIAAMKFDGKSTAQDAAVAVLSAEKAIRTKQAAALGADAPPPLPLNAPPAGVSVAGTGGAKTRQELDQAARDHMAANPGMTYKAAYKAVGGQ